MKTIIILLAIAIFMVSIVGGATPLKAKDVRDKHEKNLLGIKGVTGVSSDEKTNEIIVYIENLDAKKNVPDVLDGVQVKFIETGKIEALKSAAVTQSKPVIRYSREQRQRPVFGGISVGSLYTTAGTLGLVTYDNYILSNSHILALSGINFQPPGTPILQPGLYDGGINPSDKIGVLYKYIPIVFNDNNANNCCDAAIATLDTSVVGLKEQVLNNNNNGFYTVNGTINVNVGDIVRKSGRTTGVTNGQVVDTNATVNVSYGEDYAIFTNQIVVYGRGFSKGGDSGSAVDKNGKFAGLLFAGSTYYTIINNATYVINGLGVTI